MIDLADVIIIIIIILMVGKGACQKHPEGGGPHFLGGVQTIFTLFRGGTDQFQHF